MDLAKREARANSTAPPVFLSSAIASALEKPWETIFWMSASGIATPPPLAPPPVGGAVADWWEGPAGAEDDDGHY